jgi:Ca2+-binding EF-hand superfamily protein
MSVLEVIGMSKFVTGGIVLAALFAGTAAAARSPSVASTTSVHARGSFFTSNQNRSDVPARIDKMFKQLDLNHDGFVTRDEIASLQARFDDRMSKSTPKRAARMFDRMDINHDGKITQAEVDAARTARSAAKGKTSKASRGRSSFFLEADANKDGVVTRAEFDAATTSGKIKLRHANMRGSAIVRLFDAADANKDGRVSLEEAQKAALAQFDLADADHNSVLTPDERRQASKAGRHKRVAS